MNPARKIIRKARAVLLKPKKLGTIYMLHRCSPINRQNLYWNEHMKISPEFLRDFITEQKKSYQFISLDELVLLSYSKNKFKKPFIVMTFDDGYKDNYEYALPLFEEMRVPFVVYITNSFPGKTAFLWWYILEDILQKNNVITLKNGKEFICNNKEEKENIFLELRQLVLNLEQDNLFDEFSNIFCKYKFNYQSYNESLCLSWDMIKEMSNSPYCTIAAHTINHKALNKLDNMVLEYEILQGKKQLEEKIKKPIKHFSYPFGTLNEIGERERLFIRGCGFDTVCYSFGGDITKEHTANLLELPRKFFGELKR